VCPRRWAAGWAFVACQASCFHSADSAHLDYLLASAGSRPQAAAAAGGVVVWCAVALSMLLLPSLLLLLAMQTGVGESAGRDQLAQLNDTRRWAFAAAWMTSPAGASCAAGLVCAPEAAAPVVAAQWYVADSTLLLDLTPMTSCRTCQCPVPLPANTHKCMMPQPSVCSELNQPELRSSTAACRNSSVRPYLLRRRQQSHVCQGAMTCMIRWNSTISCGPASGQVLQGSW